MPKREIAAPLALVCILATLTIFSAGSESKPFLIGGLAQYLLPALLTLYLLVLVYYSQVIVDVLASFFLGSRKQERSGSRSWTVIIGYTAAVILALLLIRSTAILSLLGTVGNTITNAMTAFKLSPATSHQTPTPASTPYLFYYIVLTFLGIVIASISLLIGGLHRAYDWAREEQTLLSVEAARKETLQAVQKATTNLKLTGDYRDVILNCYREMCRVLSARGLQMDPHETASEFSNNISDKLHIGTDRVKGLTSLFEEARYSDHPIDDAKRSQAIEELQGLERALTQSGAEGS